MRLLISITTLALSLATIPVWAADKPAAMVVSQHPSLLLVLDEQCLAPPARISGRDRCIVPAANFKQAFVNMVDQSVIV